MVCSFPCPSNNGTLLVFVMRLICQFITWSVCNVVSVFLVVMFIVIVWYFYSKTSEKKRDKYKKIIIVFLIFLLLAMFYDYIKIFLGSLKSVYVPENPCSSDSCGTEASSCSLINSGSGTHTPSSSCTVNYWIMTCNNEGIASFATNDGVLNETTHYLDVGIPYTIRNDGLTGINYQVDLVCAS